MKSKWTKTWNASTQPRKQRAYIKRAPLHIRTTLIGSHLSKELQQKHKMRSLRVRNGDKVKVLRGTLRGKTGTVERVDTLHAKVYVTGIERVRKDGSKSLMPIHPSNLLIQDIHEDKRRMHKKAAEKVTKK